jgi:hypothetical protein
MMGWCTKKKKFSYRRRGTTASSQTTIVRVRFSEVGEACAARADSQPTRPRSRATGGRERVVDDGDPRDCLPSQLERTTVSAA